VAAFTIIETLMVVAIIAILLSMMLPGILASREAANRVSCINNMRQIAIALSNYETQYELLPPGVVNPTGPIHNRPDDLHIGWIVQLLPFLEQQRLAQTVDTDVSVYDAANGIASASKVNSLTCPSDHHAVKPIAAGGAGVSSYAGCHHDVEAPIAADNHGVFFLNSRISHADLTDGAAYTFMVGEKLILPTDLGWMSGTSATLRNTGTPVNAKSPARAHGGDAKMANDPDALFVGGFSSSHFGGANFVFGDGSVRFVTDSIHPGVYRLLGHRADGEIIDFDHF
jgi:prepilin-type processing-associated H-X9-DG protein